MNVLPDFFQVDFVSDPVFIIIPLTDRLTRRTSDFIYLASEKRLKCANYFRQCMALEPRVLNPPYIWVFIDH